MEFLVEVLPPLSENGPWIAGGSLFRTKLGLPISTDIDIFFKNDQQMQEYKSKLRSKYEGKKFEFVTDSNSKYAHNIFIKYMGRDYKIQLITTNYYDSACKLLDNFDLNICQIAYDGHSLYVAEGVMESIDNRQMSINTVNNASYVMLRCMKYAKLGFYMAKSDVDKFFHLIQKNNIVTVLSNEKEKDEYGGL